MTDRLINHTQGEAIIAQLTAINTALMRIAVALERIADAQAPQPVTLESIAVTTPPTKTAYTAGETFAPAGMVVTATYSDGTTAAVTGYTTAPTEPLTASDTTVTVSYSEDAVTVTATVSVTVTA